MKEILRRHVFICLALTIWVPAAMAQTNAICSGTTYYVSNSGSDTNPGTSTGSPWKTIAKINSFQSSLVAGDCVLFQRGGVWSEELDITHMIGASGSPITIGNYGTGNLPVIDGGQTSSTNGRNYCIDAIQGNFKWITVDGIECRNAYVSGIIFNGNSGTMGVDGVGIVLQNSYIHHDGPGACTVCAGNPTTDLGYDNQIDIRKTVGAQVLNNTVDHCGGHNCIQIDYDAGNAVVSGNVVGTNAPYCNHNCIDVKGGAAGKTITVSNNTVTCPGCQNTATAAFYTENTGTCPTCIPVQTETIVLKTNVAYNVPLLLQIVSGGNCSTPSPSPCTIDASIVNNTFYNGSHYNVFTGGSCGTSSSISANYQNNIMDGGPILINSCGSGSITWDYNDKYTSTGGPSGAHDLSVSPLFVSPGTNFHLQSGSPVLNAGNSATLGLTYMGALGLGSNLNLNPPNPPTGLTATAN